MSSEASIDQARYPKTLFTLFNLPILTLDIAIITLCGWAASPNVQRHLYGQENPGGSGNPNGEDMLYPVLMASLVSLSAIYILVRISLGIFAHNVVMPSLARILVNALAIIPAFVAGIVNLALYTGWNYVKPCDWLEPQDPGYESCRAPWTRVANVERAAWILAIINLIIILCETMYSIHLHRITEQNRRRRLNHQDRESPYPIAALYGFSLPIASLDLAIIGLSAFRIAPQSQEKDYPNALGSLVPGLLLAVSSVSAGYAILRLILTLLRFHPPIRALPRILVNSLFIIPWYIIGCILSGLWTAWEYCTEDDCEHYRVVWSRAEVSATTLAFVVLILTVGELVYDTRIHHKESRMVGEKEGYHTTPSS